MTKVSIIEDHADIRRNVSRYIEMHDEFQLIETFSSVEDFLYKFITNPVFQVDILLLDIGLPGLSGVEGIPKIKEKLPAIDIIMLTTYEEEETILSALCAGACSYISKRTKLPKIVEALRIVADGGSYMSPSIAREIVHYLMGGQQKMKGITSLSERQKQILEALSEGKSYRQIGETLFISIETVRSHVKKLYRFLEVNNKTEAIALYLKGKIK